MALRGLSKSLPISRRARELDMEFGADDGGGDVIDLGAGADSDRPYGSSELGSRYQGQSEPTTSRLHIDFDERRADREG